MAQKVSACELGYTLEQIAKIKELATTAGIRRKWFESDIDFVKRVKEQTVGLVKALAPTAQNPSLGDRAVSAAKNSAATYAFNGLLAVFGLPPVAGLVRSLKNGSDDGA